jgi:predicted RNA-binding protein with TRAM domain
MKWQFHTLLRHLANEKGLALATTFLLLLVLTVLVAVSTKWSVADINRTADYNKSREAFFIADAGIQDAINHMNYTPGGQSPGAAANNFALAFTSWPARYTNGIDDPGGKGSYTVSLSDNHDDGDGAANADNDFTVIVTSTGITDRGKMARIEAVLHLPRAQGDAAVIVEDDLDIKGTVEISGINEVLVHSNEDTTIAGTVDLQGEATAVDSCDVNGQSSTDCNFGSKYKRDIPIIIPNDFKGYATFIMEDDGTITDAVNNISYTKTGGDWKDPSNNINAELAAFDFHNVQGWKVTGQIHPSSINGTQNVPNQVILYIEHSFTASGGVGDSGDEWEVTILAEKDIEIGGNAYINNCTVNPACGTNETIQNLFLIAGDDLKTPNLKSPNIHGIFAALDQVDLGGNAVLTGSVFSNSYCDADSNGNCQNYFPYNSNVVQGVNKLHGGLTIVYNGPVFPPVTEKKVRVLTWKECTPKEINDSVATC